MKLRYIALCLSDKYNEQQGNYEYTGAFEYRTRFISNFLSRAVRKLKFETDGTYKMLLINAGGDNSPYITNDCLEISVPFDKERYEHIKDSDECSYYLELFEEGFKRAAHLKDIPMHIFDQILHDFRAGGMKNEWIYKKVLFREINMRVTMKCQFTSKHFRLVLVFETIKNRKVLCSGVALQTEPDEIVFDYRFRNVVLEKNNIYITDFVEKKIFYFELQDILKGFFALKATKRPINPYEADYYDLIVNTNQAFGDEVVLPEKAF